jgi:hypothetical protein
MASLNLNHAQGFLLYISKHFRAMLKSDNFTSLRMKYVTFAVAFLLTAALVISGIMVYQRFWGKQQPPTTILFLSFSWVPL